MNGGDEGIAVTSLQSFMLQGVLSIVLIGIALPIGLVLLFLAFQEAALSDAIRHGELFLSGGNAAFMGCVVLVASRQDAAINAAIASLATIAALVVPSYAAWAYLAVQTLVGESYSTSVVIASSAIWAGVCVLTALVMVRIAYYPRIKGHG